MVRHIVRFGSGVAVMMALACGDPEIVVPSVLSVDFYPPHGSVDISVGMQGLIAFSHQVADRDEAVNQIGLSCLGSPNPTCAAPTSEDCGDMPRTTVTVAPGEMEAHVSLDDNLELNRCYVFQVAAGIEAAENNVGPLPNDRRSMFRTQEN
ncbi:hypothetical protein ACFL6C_14050 [Myxococcota bacterium]